MAWARPAAAQRPIKRVLTIHAGAEAFPSNTKFDEVIRKVLYSHPTIEVDYYAEFLEYEEFGAAADTPLRDYIRVKFRDRPLDALVVNGAPAVQFALQHRAELFPDVPMVFVSATTPREVLEGKVSRATGVLRGPSQVETLDLALKLHPATRRVHVVAYAPNFDGYQETVKSALAAFSTRVTLSYSNEPSFPELLATLKTLPADSLILYARYSPATRGRVIFPDELLPEIAEAAPVPIYCAFDTYIGTGVVGGMMRSEISTATRVGEVTLRILDGAKPEDIPVEAARVSPIFDWRQVQRWGIEPSLLPVASVIMFREPSVWDRYGGYIFSAVAVLAVQSLLIVGLLYQRRARRRAEIESRRSEAELRESEERLRLAAEATHLGIWVRDLTRNDIWATDSWRALFGFAKSERLDLNGVLRRVHPDDRETVQRTLARALEGDGSYEIDYRVVLPGGQIRSIASRGSAQFNGAGTPILVRGVSLDVTERRKTEREAQLLRQEVAHVGRVSMMGQLASALAHEINQPLGAILRNAEAAELFMQSASPDLDEVRAILADVIKNDRRAGAVIDRMRALLKRHELEVIRLDVGDVIGDVVTLMRADAVSRHVKLDVDIAGDLRPVRGDRVHLQQVLLNLVLNGMDALNDANQEDRRVTVTARPNGARIVEVAVGDTGPGIPADMTRERLRSFFQHEAQRDGHGPAHLADDRRGARRAAVGRE